MKRIAMLVLLVCFVTGLVFVGCEKSNEDKAGDVIKNTKKEVDKVDVDKEADKAKEGLEDLTK